jgi:hypothetical protein
VYWNSKTAPEHLTAEQKNNWVPATEEFAPDPDEDNAPAAANTDEDYREDEEIEAQAQLYRIGAAAGAKSRSQRRAVRPSEIQRIWRPLYLAVRSWWTLGSSPMPDSSKTAILNSNKKITQLCEEYAEAVMSKERFENHLLRERFLNSQRPVEERASDETLVLELKKFLRHPVAQKLGIKYRFPGDEMFVKIQEVVKMTKDLEGAQEEYSLCPGDADVEAAYKKHQDDLLRSITRLLQTLRAHDIPLASVVTEFAKGHWDKALADTSPEARMNYETTLKELENPTEEQGTAWEEALPSLCQAIEFIKTSEMPTDENENILDESLELINQNNKEIQKSNLEFQIPADRDALPVQELQNIKTAWTSGDQEELSKSLAEFIMLLGA